MPYLLSFVSLIYRTQIKPKRVEEKCLSLLQGHEAKGNKAFMKGQTLYDSTSVKSLRRSDS